MYIMSMSLLMYTYTQTHIYTYIQSLTLPPPRLHLLHQGLVDHVRHVRGHFPLLPTENLFLCVDIYVCMYIYVSDEMM